MENALGRASHALFERAKNMTEGIIFYTGKKRIGKMHISKWCFFRMREYQLTPDQLEEVFRYGREIEEHKISHPFGDELITLYYSEDFTRIFRGNLNDQRFTLITCWKGVNK